MVVKTSLQILARRQVFQISAISAHRIFENTSMSSHEVVCVNSGYYHISQARFDSRCKKHNGHTVYYVEPRSSALCRRHLAAPTVGMPMPPS